jgi:DDE superfamily endonuclease
MTGEIGVQWIKDDFDSQTTEVAKGRPRLLIVDGHSSHFTRGFLEYAREHNIHVLCLPPNTTHALQSELHLNLISMQSNTFQ